MLSRSSTGFFLHYLRASPGRSITIIGLLVLAGLLEGVGVVSLIPMLGVASSGSTPLAGGPSERIVEALDAIGMSATLPSLLAFFVLAITTKAVATWFAMREVGYSVARVAADLRVELLRTVLQAKWSHFARFPLGRFANSVGQEAMATSVAYREACSVLAAVVQVVVYISVAILISWKTTLVALVAGGSLLWALRHFVEMARQAGQKGVFLFQSLAGRLVDALQALKPIKAMGEESHFLHILEKDTDALKVSQQRRIMAQETMRLVQEPVVAVLLAAGIYSMVAVAALPFQTVLVLTFVFYRLITHLNTMQMRYQLMSAGESSFWSLQEQIQRAREDREEIRPGGRRASLQRELRLESVSFRYDEKTVLDRVNLAVPAGSFVTLIGHSGAGKTTLLDLITGLQLPLSGTVSVDDVPLAELDLLAWRQCIGYVPQEMLLFSGSIRDNVTMGNEAIPRAAVEDALRAAGAWDFVQEREGGMDAAVGNAGVMLSGGQRQRLAIARALVRGPRLLILDEVTAALDAGTEAGIVSTLIGLKGKASIIAISHQQALRDAADYVYDLEGGHARMTRGVLAANASDGRQ